MDTWLRRTLYYLIGLGGAILGYAVVYDFGMTAFEGDPQTFLHSLQVVVETFTTTGFGSDSPWESPAMNVLVIVMDLTGVALIFLALPVLVFPLFEEAISTTASSAVAEDLEDHVVICRYTPRGETLIAELDRRGVDYVVVEPDGDLADEIYDDGVSVVHADPQSVAGLEDANLPRARALVADDSDRANTVIVLTAKEVDESVTAVSVVEDPDNEPYHLLAGADVVHSPRELLGESLARKVTTGVTTDLGDAVEVGEDFEVAELPIHRGSDLVGRTLAESGIRERTGVNVIGAWFQGRFESPPSPDATLDTGTVLLVTGREAQLERIKRLTMTQARRIRHGETLVTGFGQVGRTVGRLLDDAGVPHTVLDAADGEGVDVVGDATDPEVLRAAGAASVRTAILALPNDADTEFATLVLRDLNPDIEIVARAQKDENVRKMYRAGADYVLSLATVSGRMFASTVVPEEEVISVDTQVEVVQTRAPGLTGKTIGEARVRSRTGCTVVGVERNGSVVTDLGPEFRIEEGDELVIAGTDEGIGRFTELMC